MSAVYRFHQAMVSALKQALASPKSVPVPPGGALIWNWFMDLNAARTWHMNGPNPITYADIEAYARLHRWNLAPRHVAILRAMDAAYVDDFYSKRERERSGVKTVPTISQQELTPELFDAVFG